MLNILYTSIARAGGVDVVPGTEIVPPAVRKGGSAVKPNASLRQVLSRALDLMLGQNRLSPTRSAPQAR